METSTRRVLSRALHGSAASGSGFNPPGVTRTNRGGDLRFALTIPEASGDDTSVELLLLGVIGQVVCLRLLVIQLARTPDDPPLLRREHASGGSRLRRERRRGRLIRLAVGGFTAATVLSVLGIIALVRA